MMQSPRNGPASPPPAPSCNPEPQPWQSGPAGEQALAKWTASRAQVIGMLVQVLDGVRRSPTPGPARRGIPASCLPPLEEKVASNADAMVASSGEVFQQAACFEEKFAEQRSDQGETHGPGCTTLMVRGIPSRCTKEMLLQEWPLDGTWDFLYYPMRAGGRSSRGWAFINFASLAHAEVAYAHVQGLEANVRKVQSTAGQLQDRQSLLIVIKGGQLVGVEDV